MNSLKYNIILAAACGVIFVLLIAFVVWLFHATAPEPQLDTSGIERIIEKREKMEEAFDHWIGYNQFMVDYYADHYTNGWIPE